MGTRHPRAAALLAVALSAALVTPLAAAGPTAQSAAQGAPPPTATAKPGQTQDDLERIREAVGRAPAFKLDENHVRFYFQVLAPAPSFSDFVKNQDLMNGPVAGAPITHREFLDMVTPKELYSAAGIRPTEALQMAVTGLVGQMLIKKAFESATDNWRARQLRELNARIDAELASIRRDKDK